MSRRVLLGHEGAADCPARHCWDAGVLVEEWVPETLLAPR